LLAFACGAAPKEKIRQPAVAGSFYPANPADLTKMMDGFLARVPAAAATDQRLLALVAPHAGYEYSGPVAAYSYALLKGRKYERVVVIAPSHYEAFPFASIYDGDAYVTPLGTVPVDKEFATKLAGKSKLLRLSSQGHAPAGPQGEHALEDQLPWLQHMLGGFKLVPIVMGDQTYDIERTLGVELAKMIGPETLIVASSDLSHFHTYDQASTLDHKTLNAIAEWDYLSMSRNFSQQIWEACGGGPIVAAMIAAERLGATQAKVLKYANTGDVTGERARVVGYGAAALLADVNPKAAKAPAFALTQNQKDALLQLARRSVESAVSQRKLYDAAAPKEEALLMDRGAFVTLKKRGDLRGCIGYVSPTAPLYTTVRDVAAYAAVRDPRFPPVQASELRDLEYEVSVLSPMRRVLDVKQIEIGKHGLLVRKGGYEGVLLPQVPVEQHWNRKTFLEEICLKAGLPRGCTDDPDADLFMFTALVFGEEKPADALTPPRPEFGSPKNPRPPEAGPPPQ
jgi:hypothetical protein